MTNRSRRIRGPQTERGSHKQGWETPGRRNTPKGGRTLQKPQAGENRKSPARDQREMEYRQEEIDRVSQRPYREEPPPSHTRDIGG